MDEIKGYGSDKTNGYHTICHAHPEIEIPGVEVTTGPLGQGVANAVGLAIASKNLAARFNKPEHELIQSRIYCMTGDGCLMEGVALEAISLAGHLELDNLVLIYDNNQVTCDGPLDWINTEDVNNKMRASGWNVLEVSDGSYDVEQIVLVLSYAKTLKGKPTFINIKTVIGLGTSVAGTAKAHHGAFDKQSVAKSKELAGQSPESMHKIPERAYDFYRERQSHGAMINKHWDSLFSSYKEKHPQEGGFLEARISGELGAEVDELLQNIDTSDTSKLATREFNGQLIEKLWPMCLGLSGGGADLVTSNKFHYSETDVFHPWKGFSGRFIRFGIREHAMASICNGLAAYHPGTFIPLTATFFMFYLYVSHTLSAKDCSVFD